MRKLIYPWRKVIYSRRKPGCKSKAFILLECGHVCHNQSAKVIPKRKKCSYCAWDEIKTIDLIFWDFLVVRWAHIKRLRGTEQFSIPHPKHLSMYVEKRK